MWKNAVRLTLAMESASTGGGEEFWFLSTGSGAHGSFPQHTPSYPQLSVDTRDVLGPGNFLNMLYKMNTYAVNIQLYWK